MITEHVLNPYPRRIWVSFNEDFDKIKLDFQFLYEQDLQLTNEEINDRYNAIVFRVSKNNNFGYLVFIANYDSNRVLVHESLHVALQVYLDCSMEIAPQMDQEPLCYLTEYVFSLLENDIQKIIKK